MKKIKWLILAALTGIILANAPSAKARGVNDIASGGGVLSPASVGLQLYTVRGLSAGHESGSAADYQYIKALLMSVKNAGYQNIEPYNYWGLSPDQWKQLLAETGLTVTGLHHGIPGNGIQDGAPTTLEAIQADVEVLQTYLAAFGLDYSIINYAGWTTAAEWDLFFQALETYVDELHRRDIKVGFHSHNHEYALTADGGAADNAVPGRIFDKIVEKVDYIEIDMHWAARAGMVPAETIREYSRDTGRYSQYRDKLQLLHMKDMSIVSRSGNDIPARFEELGQGTINWPEVIKAGREQGIRYYIVEQDANYLPTLSPLRAQGINTDFSGQGQIRSISASYNYLKQFFSLGYQFPDTPNLDNFPKTIKPGQVSVQLYSVRSLLNPASGNADAIKAVLQQIRDIGYQNVEMWNFLGLSGSQWKTMLDELGLKVSSIHQNVIDAASVGANEAQAAAAKAAYPDDPAAFQKYAVDLQKEMIANLKGLGLNHIFIASGGFTGYDEGAYLARINSFRSSLNSAAADNSGPGAFPVTVNYHTHSQEFAQPAGYKVDFFSDLINTSPARVELDTHWALRAGVDPVDLMLKYRDRISYLHIKDISLVFAKASRDAGSESMIFNYEEIGDGTVNWDRLFRAGNAIGIQYYVVEQDANYLNGNQFNSGTKTDGTGAFFEEGDPMASIKKSFDFIKANYF